MLIPLVEDVSLPLLNNQRELYDKYLLIHRLLISLTNQPKALHENSREALDMKHSLATNFQAGASHTAMAYKSIGDGIDSRLNMRLIFRDNLFHIYSLLLIAAANIGNINRTQKF